MEAIGRYPDFPRQAGGLIFGTRAAWPETAKRRRGIHAVKPHAVFHNLFIGCGKRESPAGYHGIGGFKTHRIGGMSMKQIPEGSLTPEMLGQFRRQYAADPYNQLLENIITQNGLKNTALRGKAVQQDQMVFSIELPKVKATNQKKSGRCWAFAGLNLIRGTVAENLGADPEEFELSQNYTTFFDKLEKANSFYESVILFHDQQPLDRELLFLLESGMEQGGTWQYFRELVKKYGVVPKSVMPETKDSEEAADYTRLLSKKLRRDAAELRRMLRGDKAMDEIRAVKARRMAEVYAMLCKVLGQPPESFSYEYYDKSGRYRRIDTLPPAEFTRRYLTVDLDDYVVVGNDPSFNKEYGKVYQERDYVSDIWKLSSQRFLNLKIDDMKSLALRTLRSREPVCFACNVTQDSNRDLEVFDDELYQYDRLFHLDFTMTKAEMLDYRDIAPEHMMLFTGVNLADGRPNRWKVQNSWGDEKRNKGFFVMSDRFFDLYVLQCVIHKKYLSPDQLRMLEQRPVVFEPWDAMH